MNAITVVVAEIAVIAMLVRPGCAQEASLPVPEALNTYFSSEDNAQSEPTVRHEAQALMQTLMGQEKLGPYIPAIRSALLSPNADVRIKACRLLKAIGLVGRLNDPNAMRS